MKIAVITEDGKKINQHFGRAPYYLVLTVDQNQVVSKEMRSKLGHDHFHGEHQSGEHGQSNRHGFDAASQGRHSRMAEAIADCQVLICGGMGMGAYDAMKRLNIETIVTDQQDIDLAVSAYLQEKLENRVDLLH
ncbi:MAG TPA: NifB/NifX family molybdenum-iron cluster-binding protein [Anaerolineaceae bacterium]